MKGVFSQRISRISRSGRNRLVWPTLPTLWGVSKISTTSRERTLLKRPFFQETPSFQLQIMDPLGPGPGSSRLSRLKDTFCGELASFRDPVMSYNNVLAYHNPTGEGFSTGVYIHNHQQRTSFAHYLPNPKCMFPICMADRPSNTRLKPLIFWGSCSGISENLRVFLGAHQDQVTASAQGSELYVSHQPSSEASSDCPVLSSDNMGGNHWGQLLAASQLCTSCQKDHRRPAKGDSHCRSYC